MSARCWAYTRFLIVILSFLGLEVFDALSAQPGGIQAPDVPALSPSKESDQPAEEILLWLPRKTDDHSVPPKTPPRVSIVRTQGEKILLYSLESATTSATEAGIRFKLLAVHRVGHTPMAKVIENQSPRRLVINRSAEDDFTSFGLIDHLTSEAEIEKWSVDFYNAAGTTMKERELVWFLDQIQVVGGEKFSGDLSLAEAIHSLTGYGLEKPLATKSLTDLHYISMLPKITGRSRSVEINGDHLIIQNLEAPRPVVSIGARESIEDRRAISRGIQSLREKVQKDLNNSANALLRTESAMRSAGSHKLRGGFKKLVRFAIPWAYNLAIWGGVGYPSFKATQMPGYELVALLGLPITTVMGTLGNLIWLDYKEWDLYKRLSSTEIDLGRPQGESESLRNVRLRLKALRARLNLETAALLSDPSTAESDLFTHLASGIAELDEIRLELLNLAHSHDLSDQEEGRLSVIDWKGLREASRDWEAKTFEMEVLRAQEAFLTEAEMAILGLKDATRMRAVVERCKKK